MKDTILAFNYRQLDWTNNEKTGCLVSKQAYRVPKEARAGQKKYIKPYKPL